MSLIRRILENNTGIPPKYTRTSGRDRRDRGRIRGGSDTNSDPVDMSNQPIQPESQRVADPSRSNDDILLNNRENDIDVSSMVVLISFDI